MKDFGATKDGTAIQAVTISGHGLSATILTYGAILQDVRLDGVPHGLTLGANDVATYESSMGFHGSVVGPVANRLGGAKAVIDGIEHRFEANLNKRHTLHSGSAGTHSKVWHIDEYDRKSLTLSAVLPDGEGGFPENRNLTARFEILAGPSLRLTLTTTTDAPSIANVTNHSYWNLDGSDHLRDHSLQVAAGYYLPSDPVDTLPTGEIEPSDGTAFDFSKPRQFLPQHPPLDTTFCVAMGRRALTECLWLRGASGVMMAVATTEAGVHLYDGANARRPNGPYYEGLAIEAQGWPDAPNNPKFPSIEITPETPAVQVTDWRFSKA